MKLDQRHLGRERVLNLLYEAEIKDISLDDLLEELPLSPDEHVVEILHGIESDMKNLDALIGEASKEWSLERMPALDRAVLRIAVYELKSTDIPTGVILNEAVELSKEYSTTDSGRFINGVLASITKKLRSDEPTDSVSSV